MKPNQPNQDGKSEQPEETKANRTPGSWDQFQLLLYQIITSESADNVVDMVGILGSHLFHLAAMLPQKNFLLAI